MPVHSEKNSHITSNIINQQHVENHIFKKGMQIDTAVNQVEIS